MATGQGEGDRDTRYDDLVLVVQVEPGPTFRVVEVGGQPVARGDVTPSEANGVTLGPMATTARTLEHLRQAWETGRPHRYVADRPEGRFDVYISPLTGANGDHRLLVHLAAHVDGLGERRIESGELVIDLERREVRLGGRIVDLTRLELDLLAHLAERPGVVVARDELLHAVWQSSAEWQTAATVTEHVRRVRLKLGDPRWIESVRGIGYRFDGPPG